VTNVRVLRPFHNGAPRALTHPGEVIPVDDVRATELVRNGLAERVDDVKAAPVPENKAAPVALNKAITAETVQPERRGPGRPPKAR
jgi:hypothetical protein